MASWLAFGPRTPGLVRRHPGRMVAYVRHERDEERQDRHADAPSPPLPPNLMLAVAHALALEAGGAPSTTSPAAHVLMGRDRTVILTRSLRVALLPPTAAVRDVAAPGPPFDRPHPRAPFIGQCDLAAVYVLGIALSTSLAWIDPPVGPRAATILLLAATAWILGAQAGLYRQSLGIGFGRAIVLALQAFLGAWAIVVLIATAIALAPS